VTVAVTLPRFYIAFGAGYLEITDDVLRSPAPRWGRGMDVGIRDLVAGTGILTLSLDNSAQMTAGPNAVELLTNGGFETAGAGAPDFWANWVETVGDGAIADETVDVHSGGHAAKITAGATKNTSAYATITGLTPGATYAYSYWAHGDGTNSGRWQILQYGAPWTVLASGYTTAGTGYTHITGAFVLPAGQTGIYVYCMCPNVNGGIAYFDDVSVKALRPAGRYTPGGANCLSSFELGAEVRLTLSVDGGAETVHFVGRITSIRPSAGLYQDQTTEIMAHDWMGCLSTTPLGSQTLAVNQDIEDGVNTALAAFPYPYPAWPIAVHVDGTPVQTFLTLFDTDNTTESMASFFSKLAIGENGRIYLTKDGQLVIECRRYRPLRSPSSGGGIGGTDFALDGIMYDLEVLYDREDIRNNITVRVYPARIDTVAVRIWDLARAGCPKIEPGETFTFECPFRDPLSGSSISATSVTNPVTVYEFGSAPDYVSNDLSAFLTQANVVWCNKLVANLTNTSTKTGYLNDFQVYGLGIYHLQPAEINVEAPAAGTAELGYLKGTFDLAQISDIQTGQLFAYYYLHLIGDRHLHGIRVTFNASQTQALATEVAAAEISSTFTVVEAGTEISQDFFVNRIEFSLQDSQLMCEILGVPMSRTLCWTWEESEWDNTVGEGWTL